MATPTDLEIAQAAAAAPVHDIAAQMGLGAHLIEPHGDWLAKIRLSALAGTCNLVVPPPSRRSAAGLSGL